MLLAKDKAEEEAKNAEQDVSILISEVEKILYELKETNPSLLLTLAKEERIEST